MDKLDFSSLLKEPSYISDLQTNLLKTVIQEFPYFQSARALYLKGLKKQNSYNYNSELKKTAANTTDRSILFDYITSDIFLQNTISESQIKLQEELNAIDVIDAEEINTVDISITTFEEDSLNPNLFEKKNEETLSSENKLELGKPLEFNTSETYSFNEWLKLANAQPIERTESSEDIPKDYSNEKQTNKFAIIDEFIKNNPKIKPVKKTVSLKNLAQENTFNSNELMTETLAKVYLEQKNYKKAKQAYRILSLKYPEKSSFFADQIKEIEVLESKNN